MAATQAGQLASTRAADLQQLSQQAGQELQQQVAGVGQDVSQEVEQAQAAAQQKQLQFKQFMQRMPQFQVMQDRVNRYATNVANASKALAEAIQYRDARRKSGFRIGGSKKGGERVTRARTALAKAQQEYKVTIDSARKGQQDYVNQLSDTELGQFGLSKSDFANLITEGQFQDQTLAATTGKRILGDLSPIEAQAYQSFEAAKDRALSAEDIQSRAFLGPAAEDITKEGVMTPEQQNRLRALQQLASRSGR